MRNYRLRRLFVQNDMVVCPRSRSSVLETSEQSKSQPEPKPPPGIVLHQDKLTDSPGGTAKLDPATLGRRHNGDRLSPRPHHHRLIDRIQRRHLPQHQRPLRLVPDVLLPPSLAPLHGRHRPAARPQFSPVPRLPHRACVPHLGSLAASRRVRHRGQRLRVRVYGHHPLLQLLAARHADLGRDHELQRARHRRRRALQRVVLLGLRPQGVHRSRGGDIVIDIISLRKWGERLSGKGIVGGLRALEKCLGFFLYIPTYIKARPPPPGPGFSSIWIRIQQRSQVYINPPLTFPLPFTFPPPRGCFPNLGVLSPPTYARYLT